MAKSGRCIFCGTLGPLSKEHVWGNWLRTVVATDMKKHHFHAERIGRPGEEIQQETTLRAGDPLRSKVRVVCITCNNTWLSRIQDQAKPHIVPLIQGTQKILGSASQEALAAWCTMATMTGEFLDRDPRSIAISQEEREWLWKNGTPPSSWRIWIAHYQRHTWPGRWIHLVVPILGSKNIASEINDRPARPNMQTTTFVIGNLYVHVMSCEPFPDMVSTWAWPPQTRLSRLLVQLIPPKESTIVWPAESLTDDDADFVATAFDRMIDRSSRSIIGRRLY